MPLVRKRSSEPGRQRRPPPPPRELRCAQLPGGCHLRKIPVEAFGHIYSFLLAMEQACLRGTCSKLVDAMNTAVRNEVFIATAVSAEISLDCRNVGQRWARQAYSRLRSLDDGTIAVNVELTLKMSAKPASHLVDGFLSNTCAASIIIHGAGQIVTVGDDVLSLCGTTILSISLPNATESETISAQGIAVCGSSRCTPVVVRDRDGFLQEASSLKSLDMASLAGGGQCKIQRIGACFLAETGITQFDCRV